MPVLINFQTLRYMEYAPSLVAGVAQVEDERGCVC